MDWRIGFIFLQKLCFHASLSVGPFVQLSINRHSLVTLHGPMKPIIYIFKYLHYIYLCIYLDFSLSFLSLTFFKIPQWLWCRPLFWPSTLVLLFSLSLFNTHFLLRQILSKAQIHTSLGSWDPVFHFAFTIGYDWPSKFASRGWSTWPDLRSLWLHLLLNLYWLCKLKYKDNFSLYWVYRPIEYNIFRL